MRRLLTLAIGSLIVTTGLSAAPCSSSQTTLCLNASRFEVEVSWRDSRGRTGVGQAVSITADTGYFWFFSEANIELVIKVLDARSVNQKFWVFFGALSSVEYDLTVTDTATGASKTYHNPLGQFASVGDTGAFSPAPPAPGSETVEVEGTQAPPESLETIQNFIDAATSPKAMEVSSGSATAFTPCPDTRFGFDIGNCRFHIEVDWQDSRGRTGVGQPVQLTNDTGYFWFFSPANVELVIKVLDARSVNGKFWVFFGALSSVQYTVTVADRLTGAFRKYANPSGTFASVGDTGAFSGGQTVAPGSDPTHAVTADLDVSGGTVSAAGADGTVFTLELPADALPAPQTVTLTPVYGVDRLPFSGGFVAGVEIEPAGLELLVPAMLTIRPPSLPAPEQALPYSYAQAGEDFILYPRDIEVSSLRLPLSRLGGYGVARGSLSDAEAQAERTPTSPLDSYVQRYAVEVLRRVSGQITQAELDSRGARIFQEAYHEQVEPFLPPGAGVPATGSRLKYRTCWLGELQEYLDLLFRWIAQRQKFGLSDLEGNTRTGLDIALAKIRACAEESFKLCVENHDPGEMVLMVKLSRQLQVLGLQDEALTTFMVGSLVERCLRFELEFTSQFKLEQVHPVYSLTEQVGHHTKVPLRFLYSGNQYSHFSTFEGDCALEASAPVLTLRAPPDAHCSTSPPASGKSRFTTKMAQINLSILSNELWMIYDPGDPSFTASIKCEGTTYNLPLATFRWTYDIVHEREYSVYGFVANGWRTLRYLGNSPGDWAEKEYVRSFTNWAGPGTMLFEDTRFVLRHTPDAPMPNCQ